MTNSPMTLRYLLTIATVGAFTLSACESGLADRGDAQFSSAAASERDRAIGSGLGTMAMEAYLVVLDADIGSLTSECPRREDGEGSVTFIGDGCTSEEGDRYDGRLVTSNVALVEDLFADEPSVDPTRPQVIEFDNYSKNGVVYDGTMVQTIQADAFVGEADLSISSADDSVYAILETRCQMVEDDNSACVAEGFVEFDSLGSYAVSGDFVRGDSVSEGWLELRGADTLRVDFDSAVDGCAPYTIDGVPAGSFCDGAEDEPLPEPEPEPEPEPGQGELSVDSCGWGCYDSMGFNFQVRVGGPVADRVTVTLRDSAGTDSTHELEYGAYEAENALHYYEVSIATAATPFTCEDKDALSYKVTAYDSDGGSSCMAFGADRSAFDGDGCTELFF